MKERPIIFSASMVRAILAGHKTVTRHIVTWRPGAFVAPHTEPSDHAGAPTWEPRGIGGVGHTHPDGAFCYCPVLRCPALAGDRPWVRESWCDGDGYPGTAERYLYRATYEGGREHKWITPIHMPRRASRITLEVTNVRVERLHAITEDDAEREGVPDLQAYRDLWCALHGKGAWAQNPWVWRIEFMRAEVPR